MKIASDFLCQVSKYRRFTRAYFAFGLLDWIRFNYDFVISRCVISRLCFIYFAATLVGLVEYINNSHHLARTYINNSRYLAWKYAMIFVRGHYLFREANSFPRAKLEENCELRVTDNVQGQISKHIFAPNGDYCLYYPSHLFSNACSFENWEIFNN